MAFFKRSSLATAKLVEQCENTPSLSKKKLLQDVPTRWNSTVTMLCSMSCLKEQVLAVLGVMQRTELAPNEDEWNIIETAINLLLPFLHVTEELSSQNYPSISKVVSLHFYQKLKIT